MAFAFKRSLTIDHTQCGSSDSTNFPVLVKLDASNCGTTMKTAGNGGHIQHTVSQSGGSPVTIPADLIFTSDSGGTTKIPWEVVSYDGTNGIIWAWVKIATVSHSSNTVFWVFYGDTTVSTQQNTSSFSPANVWNANYVGVWHMNNNAASTTITDSTSNGINATAQQNTSALTVSGQIASAISFNGSSDFASFTSQALGTTHSFQCWFYSNFVNTYQTTFGGAANNGVLTQGNSTLDYFDDPNNLSQLGGMTVIPNNTWTHLVTTRNGTAAITTYENGVSQGSANLTGTAGSMTISEIGRSDGGLNYMGGRLNEMRLSSVVLTADWVTTEFNNQSNPESFLTAGSETSLGSSAIFTKSSIILQAVNRASTY